MNIVPILTLILTQSQRTPQTVSLEVDGIRREALVYANSKPAPKEGAPLVFGFHGHGGNMRNAARSFEMHRHWPEAVVVYMQGIPTRGRTDPDGTKNGWQQNPIDYGGRDLKFFDAMLARLKADHKIDPSRVFSMGHSNGGRFTYVLWAMRPQVFAAFGPSASPGTGLVFRMDPKPAFVIAGEKDQIVSFDSQKRTIDALKSKLECPPEPTSKQGLLSIFKGKGGIELATYIYPGTHTYAKEANALMVEFFKRQRS